MGLISGQLLFLTVRRSKKIIQNVYQSRCPLKSLQVTLHSHIILHLIIQRR